MYKFWIFSFVLNILLFTMLTWNIVMLRKSLKNSKMYDVKDKFRNVEIITYMIVVLNYSLFILNLLGNTNFDREYPKKYNGISYVIVPLIGVLLVFVNHNRLILDMVNQTYISEIFLDTQFRLIEIIVYILFSFIVITNLTLLAVNHKQDVITSIKSIRSWSPI